MQDTSMFNSMLEELQEQDKTDEATEVKSKF